MPSHVKLFEKLMYATLAIGLLNMFLDGSRLAAKPETQAVGGWTFVIMLWAIIVPLMALLVYLVARRRKNWARWLLAILFVVGLPGSIPAVRDALAFNPPVAFLMGAQILTQLVALVFVFTGNARDWFRRSA